MSDKKPRKPTVAQPKIKMLSPALAGKKQRIVNINADKRSEYISKGYKYIGLGEQEFNVADKPRKTKEPRGLKKLKPLIGTTQPVSSNTTSAKFYKRQLEAKNMEKQLIENKLKKTIKNILNEQELDFYAEEIPVASLINQALNRFRQKDYESCIWRLVDAAGILSKRFPNAIGVKNSTNRGYKITKK